MGRVQRRKSVKQLQQRLLQGPGVRAAVQSQGFRSCVACTRVGGVGATASGPPAGGGPSGLPLPVTWQ